MARDDGSPILEAWKLRCPHCDYDLTGLSERRCPECGHVFDPHAIWVANRHREAGVGVSTPAYVVYAVVAVVVLCLFPVLRGRLGSLLPLGLLPVYEASALFFGFRAPRNRAIIATLVIVICIVFRAW